MNKIRNALWLIVSKRNEELSVIPRKSLFCVNCCLIFYVAYSIEDPVGVFWKFDVFTHHRNVKVRDVDSEVGIRRCRTVIAEVCRIGQMHPRLDIG